MTPEQQNQALESILLESVIEKRRARRWGIFFKMAILCYIIGFTINVSFSSHAKVAEDHTAFIDVFGPIDSAGPASSEKIIGALHDAYENNAVKAVILRINSGGGSPVQGAYVYHEVQRLKALHPDIPVYSVIEDVGASAAYYIAAAADKVFANPDSIVGSIGVISEQYGLVDLLQKIGIEPRVSTAGAHKGMLHSSLPLKDDEAQMFQIILNESHQNFIDAVRKARGKALKKDPDIFSGRFWVGSQALRLGLIDGFGRAEDIARDTLHLPTVVNYTWEENIFDRMANQMQSKISMKLHEIKPITW